VRQARQRQRGVTSLVANRRPKTQSVPASYATDTVGSMMLNVETIQHKKHGVGIRVYFEEQVATIGYRALSDGLFGDFNTGLTLPNSNRNILLHPRSFIRLNATAQQYAKYAFRKAKFCSRPLAGTSTPGGFNMGYTDDGGSNYSQVFAFPDIAAFVPSTGGTWYTPHDLSMFYNGDDLYPVNSNVDLNVDGTDGISTVPLGEALSRTIFQGQLFGASDASTSLLGINYATLVVSGVCGFFSPMPVLTATLSFGEQMSRLLTAKEMSAIARLVKKKCDEKDLAAIEARRKDILSTTVGRGFALILSLRDEVSAGSPVDSTPRLESKKKAVK